MEMMFAGEKISSRLRGIFNIYNILAAANFGKVLGISTLAIKRAVEKVAEIKGRAQIIKVSGFEVVVDYAHTSDSLRAIYEAFPNKRKICVLGNTGGGRDKWKRPEMGKIADQYCDKIILTNEDPYDEDPSAILSDMEKGFSKNKPEIILDRRKAIKRALQIAGTGKPEKQNDCVVLLTGKGTDPFIMGPNGSKIPWSDEEVVKEELSRFYQKSHRK